MICRQIHVARAADALLGAFLTDTARRGLGAFAEQLPDVAAGHILECALAGPAGGADYSMALARAAGGADALRRVADGGRPDLGLTADILGELGAGLSSAGVVWLEFDMDKNGALGRPSFFVAPDRIEAPPEVAAELAERLFRKVWPGRRPPDVTTVLHALRPGTFLRQAGVMASRAPGAGHAVRLVLDGCAPKDVLALLGRLSWPGSETAACCLTDLAETHVARGACRVDLDLGSSITPSLAIELPANGIGSVAALADDLLRVGAIAQPKAAALADLAPRRTLATMEGREGTERLDFGLNHIKLSLTGDVAGRIAAKVYFSLVTTPDFGAPWSKD